MTGHSSRMHRLFLHTSYARYESEVLYLSDLKDGVFLAEKGGMGQERISFYCILNSTAEPKLCKKGWHVLWPQGAHKLVLTTIHSAVHSANTF